MTPEQMNAWVRLVGAPVIGLAIAVFLTVTRAWTPYAVPVVVALLFGPLVWGSKGRGSDDD